jgi:hypothetical protein
MSAQPGVFLGQANPVGRFAKVAALIANGKPAPDWLPRGLAHFHSFVSEAPITTQEAKRLRPIIDRMHGDLDYLIKFLPLFQRLPLLSCPDDVAVALDVLPRIRKVLAVIALSPRRKRPNVRRQFCAAVVFEAWSLIHGGRPSPIPDRLREACQEYWEACGGGAGGIEDWRRHVKEAAATENGLIRKVLSAYTTR